MQGFLTTCASAVSRRTPLLVVLNWLFFGGIIIGAFLGQAGYLEGYRIPLIEDFSTAEVGNIGYAVVSIFVFNLALSGFLLVTLTGLVFFALPVGFLLLRSLLWGVLLNALPTPLFLAAFPTVILEGEGYILAGMAGVNFGLSWLEPYWAYKEENLSRADAFKRALKDGGYTYVLVVVFLFAAALVEVATISLTASA